MSLTAWISSLSIAMSKTCRLWLLPSFHNTPNANLQLSNTYTIESIIIFSRLMTEIGNPLIINGYVKVQWVNCSQIVSHELWWVLMTGWHDKHYSDILQMKCAATPSGAGLNFWIMKGLAELLLNPSTTLILENYFLFFPVPASHRPQKVSRPLSISNS